MKLIVNISKDVYTRLFDNGRPMDIADGIVMERAIRNGTPIPDNATNGDVIMAMFPNTEIMITDERVFLRDGTIVMIYPLTWWNAPYQKGGKKGE